MDPSKMGENHACVLNGVSEHDILALGINMEEKEYDPFYDGLDLCGEIENGDDHLGGAWKRQYDEIGGHYQTCYHGDVSHHYLLHCPPSSLSAYHQLNLHLECRSK